jgi:hypothetical protein
MRRRQILYISIDVWDKIADSDSWIYGGDSACLRNVSSVGIQGVVSDVLFCLNG